MPEDPHARLSLSPAWSADPNVAWTRQEWGILVTSVTATSMAFVDATALNIAIPALQQDLQASGTQVLWIVNAYNVMVAACLLLGGTLGDLFGRRAICAFGTYLFAAASLTCGLSWNPSMLIACRVFQGIGAAFVIPTSLAILSASVDPLRRGRAIGIWSACSVVTSALGPILGGLFVMAGLWRFVFFINIPLAMIAIAGLKTWVPESRNRRSDRAMDLIGASLAVTSLGLLNAGMIEGTAIGFRNLLVIAALGVGSSLAVLFVFVELRSKHPLLPLGLFRNATLSTACLLSLLIYSGLYGMLLLLPMNLIEIQHYNAATAGLAQLPLMLLVVLFSGWSGGIYDRYGPRIPLVAGATLVGLGFLALAGPGIVPGPTTYVYTFLPPMLILGAGLGILMAPLSATIMSEIGDRQAGLASGINSTVARFASVLGIALLGPLAILLFQSQVQVRSETLRLQTSEQVQLLEQTTRFAQAVPPTTLSPERRQMLQRILDEAFVSSFRAVCCWCAGICLIGAMIAAVGIRNPLQTKVSYS